MIIGLGFVARDPRQLFETLRSNPQMLQQIRQNSPQVADAIQRGDFSMLIFSSSSFVQISFRYLHATYRCTIS